MGKPLVLDSDSARRARRVVRAARPVPRAGLDRRRDPDRDPDRAAGDADARLARPRAPRSAEDAIETAARRRRAGRARDRQRAPLPAAEALRRHDAALAPAAASSRRCAGLEVGAVYESSARVDVGGDVYDFLTLPDGRLAVVLGDVTGHGIDATADMAMAKFVFRSLAREHPEPGDFLAARERGRARASSPAASSSRCSTSTSTRRRARSLRRERRASAARGCSLPTGRSTALAARGLALGVDAGQRYDEIRDAVAPGAARLPLHGRRSSRRGAAPSSTARSGSTRRWRAAASSPRRSSPSIGRRRLPAPLRASPTTTARSSSSVAPVAEALASESPAELPSARPSR